MRSTPTCSANTASKVAARTSSGTSAATGTRGQRGGGDRQRRPGDDAATNIQTRVVPRSRIVARSALYSSSSRGVIGRLLQCGRLSADTLDWRARSMRARPRTLWHRSW